ncbi:hypothetical protein VTK73DRAFT_4684 [Phialemonium thermophilum]|uniref:mRNA decay factor PAT1 domain-containing protein n=1 Tax=Phialemonium thermophilum TaxID=223376 RepID=A0ABR3WS90_9PEZI
MSFFGFDTSRHNPSAPGFSQAHDPFAGLSKRDEEGDALEFEDTYDGLGDQLDETDDAFNDDTFGGGASDVPSGAVGKDFDFFGQTAKVANAIEEEHVRYNRQQPPAKPSSSQPTATAAAQTAASASYSSYQPTRPARTGYEKYKNEPVVEDLKIDATIWGVAPKKQTPAAPAAGPSQPPGRPSSGRKMLSLEEVEAQIRAQAKKTPQPQAQSAGAVPSQPSPAAQAPITMPPPASSGQTPGMGGAYGPASVPTAQYPQQATFANNVPRPQVQVDQTLPHGIPSPIETSHARVPSHGQGPPVTILQRPQSKQASQAIPTGPSPQYRQQQTSTVQPTHILQNPNRLSGDASRLANAPQGPSHSGHSTHPSYQTHRQQGSLSRQPQVPLPSPLANLSDQEKVAHLEQEAKRAKRNHKIFLMSRDNGLMTPQDKNFITRIQLQQLVAATGNPNEHGTNESLAEDFYYQVHSHIQAGQRQHPSQPLNNFAQTYLFQTGSRFGGHRRHHRGPENHIQRMEQQVQRAVEAAKSRPKDKQLVIEGSLGKISFSNAKTPKPLLNIKRAEAAGDGAHSPVTPHRKPVSGGGIDTKSVLRSIESVYDTLMKMEDHERNAPPPPANEGDTEAVQKFLAWQAEAQRLNGQLWKALKVHEQLGVYPVHPFIALLSYSKGMKAMQRVFKHTTHEQRITILTMIVVHLDSLDVVRGAQVSAGNDRPNAAMREKIELFSLAVMSTLFNFMNELDLDLVSGVLGLVCNQDVGVIAKSRIGASMLTMILSRAEIIKQSGGGSPQSWQGWDNVYNTFFNLLEPTLPYIFPGTVNSGEDVYVWQLLAAIGIGAGPDQQKRLVLAVKERVMDTVALAKTLPHDLAAQRLQNVNLFMRSIGLDVELLQ